MWHTEILMGRTCALHHGPLAKYVKLRVAHAPGMPGTFSPPPQVSDPDMHQGTCVTHVPWCMQRSLTSILWSRWRGKRSRHSQHMRNSQFYVSGKRSMESSDHISSISCYGYWKTSPRMKKQRLATSRPLLSTLSSIFVTRYVFVIWSRWHESHSRIDVMIACVRYLLVPWHL